MSGKYWDGLSNPRDYPDDPNARNYIANQELANQPKRSIAPSQRALPSKFETRLALVCAVLGAVWAAHNQAPWYVGAVAGFVVGFCLKQVVRLAIIGLIILCVWQAMRERPAAPPERREPAAETEVSR